MSHDINNSGRRTVLKSGLALVAASAALTGTAKAQEKLAHDLVQYQDTPKDGNQCSKCAQFVEPKACNIVASPIAPTGWCVAFAPKEG